jgi:hypothetical protein
MNGTLPRQGAFFLHNEKEHPMSIFGNIMSAIFKSANPAATAPSGARPAAPPPAPGTTGSRGATATATAERVDDKAKAAGQAQSSSGSAVGTAATTALDRVDVEGVLTKLAAQNKEKLDWRRSIVDLMKLLNLDSSHAARTRLARELHYTGDISDSAAMNIWLHRQVMQKLAENGGKVPPDLMAR